MLNYQRVVVHKWRWVCMTVLLHVVRAYCHLTNKNAKNQSKQGNLVYDVYGYVTVNCMVCGVKPCSDFMSCLHRQLDFLGASQPQRRQIGGDFGSWRMDRNMMQYDAIRQYDAIQIGMWLCANSSHNISRIREKKNFIMKQRSSGFGRILVTPSGSDGLLGSTVTAGAVAWANSIWSKRS